MTLFIVGIPDVFVSTKCAKDCISIVNHIRLPHHNALTPSSAIAAAFGFSADHPFRNAEPSVHAQTWVVGHN